MWKFPSLFFIAKTIFSRDQILEPNLSREHRRRGGQHSPPLPLPLGPSATSPPPPLPADTLLPVPLLDLREIRVEAANVYAPHCTAKWIKYGKKRAVFHLSLFSLCGDDGEMKERKKTDRGIDRASARDRHKYREIEIERRRKISLQISIFPHLLFRHFSFEF